MLYFNYPTRKFLYIYVISHNSLPHNTQLSSSQHTTPHSATNYYFKDNDNEHESFVCLPIQWSDKEKWTEVQLVYTWKEPPTIVKGSSQVQTSCTSVHFLLVIPLNWQTDERHRFLIVVLEIVTGGLTTQLRRNQRNQISS